MWLFIAYSLAGIISQIYKSDKYNKCYGAVNGILGVLNENYIELSKMFSTEKKINSLKCTPSMFLGSCRYKLPEIDENEKLYIQVFELFRKLDIGAFFYIGGNDSMDTVWKLSQYAKKIKSNVKIIGVPKTIDNDLCITDHTPGYGSAAKYIATSLIEIAHDTYIYPVKSVTIVEIMGRDAGWLTAASVLARNEYSDAPHLIYLPEVDFDIDTFIDDVRQKLNRYDNVIVAVSEGIHDKTGEYIASSGYMNDQFGHKQLSGAGKILEHIVKDKLGVKVRSVEINVLQRCASHLASLTDLNEAFSLGLNVVKYAENGQSGIMACLNRKSNNPYLVEYTYADITGIANEAKKIPREWINKCGNDIEKDLIEYIRPLIIGESNVEYCDGIPKYKDISHLIHN